VPLTPLDIHNKEFTKSFRGYDEDEVNEFLDQVVKDYEIVIREKRALEEKVNQLNERLNHFTNIEETVKQIDFSGTGDGGRIKEQCSERIEAHCQGSGKERRSHY